MRRPDRLPGGELLTHQAGFKVRLTWHYLHRLKGGRLRRAYAIDYVKAYEAARRHKNRPCLAVVNGYQAIFIWETKPQELTFITILAPGHLPTRPVVRVLL